VTFLALSGFALYASWTAIMVMSSELAPQNPGMVSGLMLGFSMGVGGLAVSLYGAIADAVGLFSTFNLIIIFPLLGAIMSFLLPSMKKDFPATVT